MACVPVYLSAADACNTNIIICGGRYASYELAAAACGALSPPPPPPPPPTLSPACCGPSAGSSSISATVLSFNPDGSSTIFSVTLVRSGTSDSWSGSATGSDGSTMQVWVMCGVKWTHTVQRDNGLEYSYATSVDLVPTNPMSATGHLVGGAWATQYYSITVGHPCPA